MVPLDLIHNLIPTGFRYNNSHLTSFYVFGEKNWEWKSFGDLNTLYRTLPWKFIQTPGVTLTFTDLTSPSRELNTIYKD